MSGEEALLTLLDVGSLFRQAKTSGIRMSTVLVLSFHTTWPEDYEISRHNMQKKKL